MIDVSQVIVVEELPHFNMLLVVLQDYIHYPNRQKKEEKEREMVNQTSNSTS
jgi:hypothetical protein